MLKIRRVVVGISGGVDSAVATLLLKNRGYDVQAVFMQNWDIADETGVCKADEDYQDAALVCTKLGVPLHKVNFVKQYWNDVFSDLLNEYQNGGTPNPDILCNQFVKFHSFYHHAREHFSADAIATGHYAKTSFGPYLEHYQQEKFVKLFKAKDEKKDQTLFLCQIKQKALRRTMFPLGDLTKPQVKQIANENGLYQIAQKKESMGICFIGLRNFQEFIAEYVPNKPGNFIDVETGKIVGQHNGIHQWTLGQRTKIHGLPIAYFTAKKNTDTSNIYVAEGTHHPALFSESLYTSQPHWIHSRPVELDNGDIFECDFKFQHVENFIRCQICETHKGLIVILQTPRRSLTPGQFAVFYKDNECVGSAKILHAGPSNFNLYWLQNNKLKNVSDMLVHKKKLFKNIITEKLQSNNTNYCDKNSEHSEVNNSSNEIEYDVKVKNLMKPVVFITTRFKYKIIF